MKTIVSLSGGLDSATVLAKSVQEGQVLAVGFSYGQRHTIELTRASIIAAHYDVVFERIDLPIMPKVNDVVFAGRNLVFASILISMAQARGYDCVAFGCNASDWRDFPDCRPEFWNNLKACADAYNITVLTPLIDMNKQEIVAVARNLGVPIEKTWSCYEPQGSEPCGKCLACTARNEALAA